MSNNKQTAVQKLANKLSVNDRARYNGAIEEALEELKASDSQFKVFYDKDNIMRVLYKSSIQGKFGLY